MFEVISSVKLDDSEIQLDFIRASDPVGQNVNKVSIAIQLRFARASFSSIILASSFFLLPSRVHAHTSAMLRERKPLGASYCSSRRKDNRKWQKLCCSTTHKG